MNPRPVVNADDFRIAGEKMALYVTLFGGTAILIFLIGVSFGIILLLVALSVLWVKVRQGQFIGTCVRVSERQFPDLYQRARLAAERLGMELPDVFVKQSPFINAFAIGFLTKKSVVLHSALIEAMDEDELSCIIAHELGHVKCGHTTWLVLTSPTLQFQIPILSNILELFFLYWSRKAEYTADRAGLLGCRNLRAAISSQAKLSVGAQLFEKLDLDYLVAQRKELDEDDLARWSEAMATHPYMLNRIHAFKKFYEGEPYKKLTAEVPQVVVASKEKSCAQCGAKNPPGGKFCIGCGKPLAAAG